MRKLIIRNTNFCVCVCMRACVCVCVASPTFLVPMRKQANNTDWYFLTIKNCVCVCVCKRERNIYIGFFNIFFLLEIAIDFVLRKRILDLGSVWTFLLHVDIYVAVHY